MAKRILITAIILSLVFIFGLADGNKTGGYLSVTDGIDNTCLASNGAPDLVIPSITWSPEEPSKGDSIAFSVSVKNQGSSQAVASRVYFYIDGISWGEKEVPKLDAGHTGTVTFTWVAQAGSHTVKAVVDEQDAISESDETNNEKEIIFVTFPPDLIIGEITWLPESPVESDNMTFTVFIENQGSGRSEYCQVALYIDDHLLPLVVIDPIDSGATGNQTFGWIARGGFDTVRAVADFYDKLVESDENNNEKTVALSVLLPDLIVESITWSSENLSVGERIIFTVNIKNQGTATADYSRAYFYVDGLSKSSQRVRRIGAGDTERMPFAWIAQEGSHEIKAVADKEGQVMESEEGNNEHMATFSGASYPDLIIEEINWSPESPSLGETVAFTVIVKNQGGGSADYSYVTYYIDNTLVTSAYVNALSDNATDNGTFTWVAQSGYHKIRAVADSNMRILESDETNNERVVIYPVPPDLVVEAITWLPKKPTESDNVTFTVTIKNQGDNRADFSSVTYYIDEIRLTSAYIDSLESGATENKSFAWVAQSGSNNIKAIVDEEDRIFEGNENNNEMTVVFSPSFPDLVVEEITWLPEKPAESDNVTFTVNLKNKGDTRADYSRVNYYLDGAYLSSSSIDPLEPKAVGSVTFIWTAQGGSHEIKAVADGANDLTESDESNNEKAVTLSVLLSPASEPESAPKPVVKPQPAPQAEPRSLPSLGKGIWLDVLFVLVALILVGTFVSTILGYRKQ